MQSKRRPSIIFGVMCVSLFGISADAPAGAQDHSEKGAHKNSTTLEDFGSFFVGGRKIQSPFVTTNSPFAGEIVVDQMYVQYWIPRESHKTIPAIVMLHGSTHSGKTYETTPDGREGWAHYFIRKGIPVYVVDQAGRGRSGFNRTGIVEAKVTSNPSLIPNITNFEHGRAWTVFRFGPQLGTAFPASKFPFKAVDQYFAQLLPTIGGPGSLPGLVALLDRIGPAVLMGHSAGGQPVVNAAIERPDVVKAVVDVEAPGGCPVTDEAIERAYKKVPLLSVYGDIDTSYPALPNDVWVNARANCDSNVARINAAGGTALNLYLPDIRIFGNSHMLMMDKNSDEIAGVIYKWLLRNVKTKKR